jgi:hypothetical protein
MTTSNLKANIQFSSIFPVFVFFLLFSSCSTDNYKLSYVAIQRGAEDDNWIIKFNWDIRSNHILDTLYFLSPLIDNMKREEYSYDANLSRLFYKYPPHSIFIDQRTVNGDSLFFKSNWYSIYNDSLKFSFSGRLFSDSVVGSLSSFYYAHNINKRNSDTSTVTFIREK